MIERDQPSMVRAPARPSLAGRSAGHATPPASRRRLASPWLLTKAVTNVYSAARVLARPAA